MLDFPTDVPNLFEKVQAQDWERLLVDRGSGIGRPTWQTTSDGQSQRIAVTVAANLSRCFAIPPKIDFANPSGNPEGTNPCTALIT
jgi:hypothetical protein